MGPLSIIDVPKPQRNKSFTHCRGKTRPIVFQMGFRPAITPLGWGLLSTYCVPNRVYQPSAEDLCSSTGFPITPMGKPQIIREDQWFHSNLVLENCEMLLVWEGLMGASCKEERHRPQSKEPRIREHLYFSDQLLAVEAAVGFHDPPRSRRSQLSSRRASF